MSGYEYVTGLDDKEKPAPSPSPEPRSASEPTLQTPRNETTEIKQVEAHSSAPQITVTTATATPSSPPAPLPSTFPPSSLSSVFPSSFGFVVPSLASKKLYHTVLPEGLTSPSSSGDSLPPPPSSPVPTLSFSKPDSSTMTYFSEVKKANYSVVTPGLGSAPASEPGTASAAASLASTKAALGYEDAAKLKTYQTEEELTANALLSGMESNKDWNKEFQELLELPDNVEKFKRLRHLSNDFLYVATSCAKIIISELFSAKKTITPVTIGGRAGGNKYVYRNILFKLASDVDIGDGKYMYGGDGPSPEKAMKAASHELKGSIHYSAQRIPGVHFSMLVLIDYKGYRVTAQSLLPISKSTIVYGSADGGETIHAENEALNPKIRDICRRLNLAPHLIHGKTMYGAGDQEVHLGNDGRFYAIDLARTFPPFAPPKTLPKHFDPRSVFYHMIRPEYLLKCPIPLVSDAYTGWGRMDPQYRTHNEQVYEASVNLWGKVIPQFSKDLDAMDAKLPLNEDMQNVFKQIDLIGFLHRTGINVRFLGKVRNVVNSERMKSLLLMEMISRIVKNKIREQMRNNMERIRYLSSEDVKEIIVHHFNDLLRATADNMILLSSGGSDYGHDEDHSPVPSPRASQSLKRSASAFATSPSSASAPTSTTLSPLGPLGTITVSLRRTDSPHRAFGQGMNISPPAQAQSSLSLSKSIPEGTIISATHDQPPLMKLDDEFKVKLCEHFGDALSLRERSPSFALRTGIASVHFIIWRLCQQLGVELSQDSWNESLASPATFDFVYCDILQVIPKIRFMNELDEAEGMELLLTAISLPRDRRTRLLKLAGSKFEQACVNLPNNFQGLFRHSRTLYEQSKLVPPHWGQYLMLLSQAYVKLEQVLKIHESMEAAQGLYIKVALVRVEAEPSKAVAKAISLIMPRALLLRNDKLPTTFVEACRLLKIAERQHDEELLSCVGTIFAVIYQVTSTLLSPPVTTTSRKDKQAITYSLRLPREKLEILHFKSLLCLGNARVEQADWMHLSGANAPTVSPPLSASNSGPKISATSTVPIASIHEKLAANPTGYAVDVLNTRLLRFQAAERFCEALEWFIGQTKTESLLEMIIDSLPTLLELASKSYQLKGLTEQLMRVLTSLSVHNEQINTTLVVIAPELQKLTRLDISASKFTQKTLEAILPSLTTLQELDVSNCPQFDDPCLQLATKALPRLESIALNGTNITSSGYSFFIAAAATRLVSLNISGCKIKQNLITETCQLATRLVSLDASFTLKELPERVNEFPALQLSTSLTSLHLIDCFALTDWIVHYANSNLTKIVEFSIGTKRISEQGVRAISTMGPRLKSLALKGLTPGGEEFSTLFGSLGSVERLALRACCGITDKHLANLSPTNTSLQSLSLSGCSEVIGSGLVIPSLRFLRELDLSYMDKLESQYALDIIKAQPQLTCLKASSSQCFDDDLMATVATATPGLLELQLDSLHGITDSTVDCVVQRCTQLTSLSLADCRNITRASLLCLRRAHLLTSLNIRHCKVKEEDVEDLMHSLVFLKPVVFNKR